MHVLLPPSETKRDGGCDDAVIDLAALGFSGLNPTRRTMLAAVRALSSNRSKAAAALGLSKAQHFEVDRNRALRYSAVLPAMDRYTGVLYDALGSGSLPTSARDFAGQHVVIHSALFGLLRASDLIPAYRLSQNSRVPNHPLKRTWQSVISGEIEHWQGLILDLRSESYVALGPAPERAIFLRVVTVDSHGARRALNHFNKKAKGEFVRELLLSQINHPDAGSLVAWASDHNIRLEHGAAGELQLVI